VWAPNARRVSVVGDFNDWDAGADVLVPVEETGIWEGVVSGAAPGQRYKYDVDGHQKADPVAFRAEEPPRTASVVFESAYKWGDAAWVDGRRAAEPLDGPV
jgi:1,4-alpha-glucan branching enzyme